MNPAVHIDIGELVLHGFPPGDRQRIVDALHRELACLLGEVRAVEALSRLTSTDRLPAGRFECSGADRPEVIGARVARALVEGLLR